MKALNELTGSAKARLLHELLPEEIEGLITYIEEYCAHFSQHAESYRRDWKNGLISFNYWLALADETAKLISRYKLDMIKNSKVFSEQLYFTYTSLFVSDCIVKYADRENTSERFKLLVQVLFH
ncbi:hypothetical protein [Pedobacter paludis]|uniref:Uncharacterized protein n=1 Tax=Pedobacter paludis TaxID=2203212 RepID=A0A317F276_9SPHI|nr:hypothetical protein [Pedobacter paludis]PWS33291.1 hypothetical protein DF947_01310 [Pedobacter paludis]